MDCVNHSGAPATAYCQNCGKGLCVECIASSAMRHAAGGMILCNACIAARQAASPPFVPMQPGGSHPTAAAVLGLIPGVGAMYNGQFFKGLIHVVIFAVLISITDHYPIFGLFIAAWILYQSFEAYHTAVARRNGDPLPDPLGLNEVGNWLNLGTRHSYPPAPGQGPFQPPAPGANPEPNGTQTGFGTGQSPYQTSYQPTSGASQQGPYAPPGYGSYPGAVPPIPPIPPVYWRRREPIGAIVLIALGVMFLLGQLDIFTGRMFELSWPLLLIALGVWLMIRRAGEQGGCK